MCRRFALSQKDQESLQIYPGYDSHLSLGPIVKAGTKGWILVPRKDTLSLQKATFGLMVYDKLIYNARSETIMEKKLFQDAFLTQRIVIPCSSFDESDAYHIDHSFHAIDQAMFYLAGILISDCFVILTQKGDDNVSFFHPRMPLCLKSEDLSLYLDLRQKQEVFAKLKKPDLISPDFTEQLSLF